MAEKRMFSNKITQSDPFLAMPPSSQNLYWHLSMDADDEGFVNRPMAIMRMVNASQDDLNILIAKKFVIPFDVNDSVGITNVVVVIKHWFIHNTLRKERLKFTNYTEQKNMLFQTENGAYSLLNTAYDEPVRQVSDKCQHSVLEDSVLESSVLGLPPEKDSIPYSEIIDYLNSKGNKKFRVSQNHNQHIKARWNEGYRLNDFKKVVDIKVSQWSNDPMTDGWLRPRTLFGPKFEDYINEKLTTKSQRTAKQNIIQPTYKTKDQLNETPEELDRLRKELGINPGGVINE